MWPVPAISGRYHSRRSHSTLARGRSRRGKAIEEAQHLKKLIQDFIASFIKVGDKRLLLAAVAGREKKREEREKKREEEIATAKEVENKSDESNQEGDENDKFDKESEGDEE
ncbi:hypothetical protein H5410_031106 [Solanum commersonii]|uniref:Uncharacterized protein n=1 Tax=Solanum commersonii TaxID=4109 RepID=A0A9J5YJA8_SOLCO|nr:hypothetical protein H5410_031106 [Solanum commersonii]